MALFLIYVGQRITQILSFKHQNCQKIIQYSDNLTITHAIPRYFGCNTKERCKITSNPPNRTIWFVVAPLWFVDAAFFISKHPTSVKNHLHFRTFLPKSLHKPNKSLTFAVLEPPSLLTMLKSGVVLFLYHNEIIVWQVFHAAWWYGRAAAT